MKKFTSFLLSLIFCIGLTGCENNDNSEISVNSANISDNSFVTPESVPDNSSVTSEAIPDLPFETSFPNGDELYVLDISDSNSELKHYKVSLKFNEDNVENNVDFLIKTVESVSDTSDIASFSCYDSQYNLICIFTTLNYGKKPHINDETWLDENYKAVFYKKNTIT